VNSSLEADTFIVAGSSLEVLPAASLTVMASRHEVTSYIVNLTSTSCDSLTNFLMDVVDFFQKLKEVL
jgi:NAD-dependent SIR2 family protein deacetylase